MSERAADNNPALDWVALRHRVRTITDGAVELGERAPDNTAVTGAVVGSRAFVQTADPRGLGPAMRWAAASGADTLTLVVDAPVAGSLARRAGLLDFAIDVWAATGPEVVPAEVASVVEPPELPVAHRRFASLIAEAGARPIDDHGMLVAEVAGLEVARVVDGDGGGAGGGTAGIANGSPRLAVGVGQADRELQQYIHGHLDDDTNLRRAIAAVVKHRHPGGAAHPLTRVARQRWLRSRLLDQPSLVGLTDLDPVIPLRPRETILGDEPSAAAGDGTVVVCSVGVDLDLLPEAVDYRARHDPEAALVIVVPERDLPLVAPTIGVVPRASVRSVPSPWES